MLSAEVGNLSASRISTFLVRSLQLLWQSEEYFLVKRTTSATETLNSSPKSGCSLVPGVAQVGSEVVDALEAVGAIGDSVDTLLATGPLISLAGQERSNRLKLNLGFSHELETMAAIFFVNTDTV